MEGIDLDAGKILGRSEENASAFEEEKRKQIIVLGRLHWMGLSRWDPKPDAISFSEVRLSRVDETISWQDFLPDTFIGIVESSWLLAERRKMCSLVKIFT